LLTFVSLFSDICQDEFRTLVLVLPYNVIGGDLHEKHAHVFIIMPGCTERESPVFN